MAKALAIAQVGALASAFVIVDPGQQLQCMCAGTSSVRMEVVISCMLSVAAMSGFTVTSVSRLWRSANYCTAVLRPRRGLLAYSLICFVPQA